MNLQNIFSEIEKVDPEVYDRLDTRRKTMQRFSFIGKTLAMAAVPAALGSMFKKAYGQTNADIIDALQFAFLLENLEAQFYIRAAAATTIIPTQAAQGALNTIRDHENAHVTFLRTALTGLGVTVNNQAFYNDRFDFTGGKGVAGAGPFQSVFTNYGVMLAVAQTFEDTGVRAYKGQAPRLINNNDVLTAALQIHSVEARHAAHIRYMRRNLTTGSLIPGTQTLQPWITLNQTGIDAGTTGNAAIQPAYDGEQLTTQAGASIVNIGGATISANEASEAFDEPLDKPTVEAIVNPFIK